MGITKRWPFKKNKTGAINCCRAKGAEIKDDVCYASIKQALHQNKEVFWANMDDKTFFGRDWTFIFNNQYKKCFYVVTVPDGKLTPDLSKVNRKKDLVDWNIVVGFYRDVDSGFNFEPFGVERFFYDDDDIRRFDV